MEKIHSLPKVLIFGQPFNNITGGGITLSHLFKGWDKEKLAVASIAHLMKALDFEICTQYYQLGEEEQKWKFPFRLLQKKFKSGLIEMTADRSNCPLPNPKLSFRKKCVERVFFPLFKYFGLLYGLSKLNPSTSFLNWVKKFKPELLYIQVSNRQEILFAQELYDHIKIPLIIHVMDDWPSTISDSGLFKKFWQKKIDKDFRSLLSKATLCMSISEDMAQEYKLRYGKEFATFHNSIDIDFWNRYQRNDYNLKESPSILYAGRLGIAIEESLETIAKAIKKINDELNISLKFILQTKERPFWFHKYDCVEHRAFVSYDELPKIFSTADFLIMPYDFSKRATNYVRYSMPTKIPEYMISGTPIIVFAPAVTTIVKDAQKYEWAKVITKNDSYELLKGIKSLIENGSERKQIAGNAIRIAEEKYNATYVQNSFRNHLSSIIRN